jgi:hypothetical protein
MNNFSKKRRESSDLPQTQQTREKKRGVGKGNLIRRKNSPIEEKNSNTATVALYFTVWYDGNRFP